MTTSSDAKQPLRYQATLTLAALGVVYGDIGTSPLYALRECFHGAHALPINLLNVYGVLSLIFWSLVLVITLKYTAFVMRAHNRGEGGVLALVSLTHPTSQNGQTKDRRKLLLLLGLFGAGLLYGDGIITPAISVLSAVEGLELATPLFQPYVIPITIVILCGLFLMQSRGTSQVGTIFGPFILVWFTVIGALGVIGIAHHPEVLQALNPYYAVQLFFNNHWHAFTILGSVVLVVTGGEALYADMGHFGAKPIRLGWLYVVLPSLVLNYYGQGALILENPEAASNPFYRLAPDWALYWMVGLATGAAVIASQALISGAYSLTKQAVQLGYLPRLAINHTSKEEIGQIYVPFINWVLLGATIWLVVFFRTSSALATAYGLAVTGAMVITTILVYFVARDIWRWSRLVAILVVLFFLIIDVAFFAANLIKFFQGGWFPFMIGASILVLMTTWRKGRRILADRLVATAMPFEVFQAQLAKSPPHRISGTAVFMNSTFAGTPPALVHNVKHNKVLHRQVLILKVKTAEQPYVSDEERVTIEDVGSGFFRLEVRYGYMDTPNVPKAIKQAYHPNLVIDEEEITYYLGRETLIASPRPGMHIWREKLFAVMSRNAERATTYFKIPPEQVVEIGIQVEL